MDKLTEARQIINEVDQQVAKLFERRMEAVKMVAEYKIEKGLPIFDSSREAEVLKKNSAYIENDELVDYYLTFQQNMMDVSKSYQKKLVEGMTVGYSGIEGAYAQIAASKIFPHSKLKSYKDFEHAYNAVVNDEVNVAVLPIENSTAGEVGQVVDLMYAGNLYVNGVYDLHITHNLMALPSTDLSKIKKVVSHPQALDQCGPYLREHGYEIISCSNTAIAAKMVADGNDETMAAIASKETAQLYGLKILQEKINTEDNNTTRFAVLSKTMNKTSYSHSVVIFAVKNEAGTLAKALNIIAHHGYSLRCIKSRAETNHKWEYYFYIEVEGNLQHKRGQYMLDELSEVCSVLKLVGTFNDDTTL